MNYRKDIAHKISYLFISEEVVTAILKETVLKSCLKKKKQEKTKVRCQSHQQSRSSHMSRWIAAQKYPCVATLRPVKTQLKVVNIMNDIQQMNDIL